MNLRALWTSKRKRRLALGGLGVVGLGWGACAFLRISNPGDVAGFLGMARECPPIWRQFALRRFAAGDSAAELLRRFPPSHRAEFGRYGVYTYHQTPNGIQCTALSVLTRDGRLLSARAGSCTWQYAFFHSEDAELDRMYADYEQSQQEDRERLRQEKQQP